MTIWENRSVWFFRLVLLCIFFIPLSQFLSVRLLFVATTLSFFVGSWGPSLGRLLRNASEVMLYLAVLVLGLVYSADLPSGLRTLETSFALVSLPLIFCRFDSFDSGRLHSVYYSFSAGLLAACFVCLGHAIYMYNQTGDPSHFYFESLTAFLGSQPTYMAYYLIFAIGFGIYIMYNGELAINIWLATLLLLFFFIMLMLTGGRTSLISLLLMFSYFILKFLLDKATFHKGLAFALVCFMIAAVFVLNSSSSAVLAFWSERSDYWERYMLWEAAIKANPHTLFGVGTGDYKDVLNAYYVSHGLGEFAHDSYNSHNQFIQTYFAHGLMGLFALLYLIGKPLYLARRSQSSLGVMMIFTFLVYGMTEVFLGRYQGVVFFALVHQLFATHLYFVRQSLPVNFQ